jgi:hypothetical protein
LSARPERPIGDASDLRHYGGATITPALIKWNGRTWYAKDCHGERWREVFAWRLGREWLNMAEVAYSEGAEHAVWNDGRQFVSQPDSNLVLIRIAQGYEAEELPINDLDRAIAAELVFSMWSGVATLTLGIAHTSPAYRYFSITTLPSAPRSRILKSEASFEMARTQATRAAGALGS